VAYLLHEPHRKRISFGATRRRGPHAATLARVKRASSPERRGLPERKKSQAARYALPAANAAASLFFARPESALGGVASLAPPTVSGDPEGAFAFALLPVRGADDIEPPRDSRDRGTTSSSGSEPWCW